MDKICNTCKHTEFDGALFYTCDKGICKPCRKIRDADGVKKREDKRKEQVAEKLRLKTISGRSCNKCGIKETKENKFYETRCVCKNCLLLHNKQKYEKNNRERVNRNLEEKIKKLEEKRKQIELGNRTCPECGLNEILDQIKFYNSKNSSAKCKNCLRQQINANRKKRFHEDSIYRIKHSVSVAIRTFLSKPGKVKNGKTFKALPYTGEELKLHLENLFEPWMNWNNWGVYNLKTWNDKDKSTWTWQIDHIVPHSSFDYNSLEHPAFFECWALSNLRPISSKDNILKGDKLVFSSTTNHMSEKIPYNIKPAQKSVDKT